MKRLLLSGCAFLAIAPAFAQTVIQSGPWAKGHAPVYASPGGSQPFMRDSGPAGGGPLSSAPGITEGLYVVPPAPGGAPAPWANTGTGPGGTNWCDYDGPPSSGAYHYLCLSPNAAGGALIAYGAVGVPPLPLSFNINGDVGQPLLGVGGVLPISRGGTGASTQPAALTNILDGSIIQVVNGGTGASTPPGARANLGLGPNIMVLASDAGMKDDGVTDNAPFEQALMDAVMPATNGGTHVVFAPTNGVVNSPYYFSSPLRISRAGTWDCGGYSPLRAVAGTTLVFAPGVDGVRLEGSAMSADGGSAASATFENCALYSLGFGRVPGGMTAGSNQLVTAMQPFGTLGQPGYIPPSSWSAGDGFVVWGGFTNAYIVTSDVVTTGAFSGTGSITNGVLTISVASSGTLVAGSTISYVGVPANVGGLWVTSQLSGTPGGVGAYQLNQTRLPDFASGAITSSYGILTVPPTVPTAATTSFILGATTVPVTTGACSGIVPGETLQDTQSGTALTLGTVKYCVPGGPNDTVTLNAGSLRASVGGTDSLKFVSVTLGKILPMSSWEVIAGGTVQQAIGTYVYAQVSSSEIGGVLGGGGVYTLSAAQPMVTTTTSDGRNLEFAPASPPGSFIDSATGAAGAQTLTVHTGFEPTITNTTTDLGGIWQLPAIQGYRITTTAGLSTFTVTAGPSAAPTRMLEPGDFIDSVPFPYGCAVFQVSGSGGSQSVTLAPSAVVNLIAGATPCAAASSGSYTLWELPSGLRMPFLGHALYNYVRNFAWGFNLYGSSGSIPLTGLTGSYVADNSFENSIVGFMDSGDNTSANLYLKNLGKHSYFVDFARLGTLGDAHIGDNGNAAEDGQAALVLAVFCGSLNADVEVGGYLGGGTAWAPACIPNTGMLFQPTGVGAPTHWLISPSAAAPPGTPVLSKSGLTNDIFAFAPDLGSPGVYFNSTSENASSTPPYRMDMTTAATQGPGTGLAWLYNPLYDNWQTNMAGLSTLALSTDVWGAGTGWVPAGGYSGASASAAQGRYHGFPLGFMMGGAVIGNERLVDSGTAAQADPSASVTASQAFMTSSTIIAVSSTTGVTVGYTPVDTTISATTILGTVKSSNSTQLWLTLSGVSLHASSGMTDTLIFGGSNPITASDFYDTTMTMIPVASCAGVSNGQAVRDLTDASAAVGFVSACGTHATMILANTAGAGTASSGTGDTIVVSLRRQGDFRLNLTPSVGGAEGWAVTDNLGTVVPTGLIAGDSSGKVWPTASVKTTIAALPTCASGISGNNAVVTNGTAVGVGGYGTAVAATGAATRRVFCDGAGWLYD